MLAMDQDLIERPEAEDEIDEILEEINVILIEIEIKVLKAINF